MYTVKPCRVLVKHLFMSSVQKHWSLEGFEQKSFQAMSWRCYVFIQRGCACLCKGLLITWLQEASQMKETQKEIAAAAQLVPRKLTCHRVDVPVIRGTFSGVVVGSLQCLPECIISWHLTALKCHISAVMNWETRDYSQTSPLQRPH